MAGEASEQGAGGTPGPDGGGQSGGTGTPAAPGQSTPVGISLDALPEELRGKSENEIKFTLNTLVRAVRDQNQKIRDYEDQLRNVGRPAPGSSRPSSVAPEEGGEPEKPPKPLEEWLLSEPEKALDYWARQRFGPQLSRLQQLEDRVGSTEFDFARQEFEDFDEYEEDIRLLLKESGTSVTRETVRGAYMMALGRRALDERNRTKRSALNPEVPKEESTPPAKQYQKTSLSEDIRIASGLSEEDYYEKFAKDAPLAVKLPGVSS